MKQLMQIENYFNQIERVIASVREQKGKSKVALGLLDKVLNEAQDLVVSLLLEKQLIYHHMVMEEDAKPKSKRDFIARKKSFENMYKAAREVQNYVQQNKLARWDARACRCLGRTYDYGGEYKKAINCYKKAIKMAKKDPEFIKYKTPRWLEYEAFIAYSTMMIGKVKEGKNMSKKVFSKFISSKEGLALKKDDYPTWAIWASGIAIRYAKVVVDKKLKTNRKDALKWLELASGLIEKPVGSKKWVGKVDFGFRKDEISSLRKKLVGES